MIKITEKQHSNLEGENKTHQQDINAIPGLEDDLDNAEKGLKQINSYIFSQKKVIAENKKKIDELDTKKSKYNTILEKIGELEQTKNQNKKELNEYNQKQVIYKKIKDKLKEYFTLELEVNKCF